MMIDSATGWTMLPLLILWSSMLASLIQPSSLSKFLFYTYLFCLSTIILIAEIMGSSNFSRNTYFQILIPLGSIGAVYWILCKRVDVMTLKNTIIKIAAGFDVKIKFVVILWCFVLLYIGFYIVYTTPGHSPDAQIYHLPGPVMWVLRHSIDPIPHMDLRINYLPHSTEILYGFYYFITGSWQGVELVNLIIGGFIWPLSLYILLSSVSTNRSWALLIALVGATSSVNIWQMYSAYVDVHMASLMTGAIALIIDKEPKSFQIGGGGLAAGLAISVKTMALLGLAPISIILFLQSWKHRHRLTRICFHFIIFYSVIVVVGGAVYLKSWVQFHNPVYPFPLDLKFITFFGPEFVAKWGSVSGLIEKGNDVTDAFYKTFLWGFALLFGCFQYVEKYPPKGGLGFSIEIINYASLLILGTRIAGHRIKSKKNLVLLEQLYQNKGVMIMNIGLLAGLTGVFLLSFWPWGLGSSSDQLLNIYNGVIYSAALVFLVIFTKYRFIEAVPQKVITSSHIYKAGLSIFCVIIFIFLLIKFYAPLTFLNRFAFLIVLIPLILFSLGVQLLSDSAKHYIKIGIIFVFMISLSDSLIFKDPRVPSQSVFLSPMHKSYKQIQAGTERMYWSNKKYNVWRQNIQQKDILLVITNRANHNIRYHMPGFKHIVFMAHPEGPFRMDADSDQMPHQIKQDLEQSYRDLSKKKYRGDYSIGINYLSYLVKKVGITKIYAETPVPESLLPCNWFLLQKTNWGSFYRVTI